MKPTKNRYFCVDANKPKILFKSEGAAKRFIEYNAEEILEEEGRAPVRVYYCIACAGWHVTSQKEPDHRKKSKTERYFEKHKVFIGLDPVKIKDKMVGELVDCVANFFYEKEKNRNQENQFRVQMTLLHENFIKTMNENDKMKRQLWHYMPVIQMLDNLIHDKISGTLLECVEGLREDKAAYNNAACIYKKIKGKVSMLRYTENKTK